MRSERFLALLLAAIGTAAIVAQLLSLANGRSAFWGLNAPVYLPLPVTIAIWVATSLTIAWLLGLRIAALEAMLAKLASARLPRFALPLLVLLAGAFYWNLRSGQTVLGDAWSLVTDLPNGLSFHPRQPFAIGLQQLGYRIAGGNPELPPEAGTQVALTSVAIVNILMGLVFVVLAWVLGRAIVQTVGSSPETGSRPKVAVPDPSMASLGVTLLLLTQGYALLFFGYIETYAAYAVCNAAFLFTSIQHLRGRLPLVAPALILVFSIGLHMSAIVLAPAFAFLALRGLLRPATRKVALRDLAITVVGIIILDQILRRLAPDYSLWKGINRILGIASHDQGSGAGAGYLLSKRHWRDFLNEQYLLGPVAGLAFIPALLHAWLRNSLRRTVVGYLAFVAVILFGASWATSDPSLGYARDWDLYAPTGVAFTAAFAAILVALVHEPTPRLRLLAGAVLLSALHLGPWAIVNHSEARSMERFATLPLGQARNEVVIGNWHLRNGRRKEAIEWFEKALQIEPRNSNAYAFLGHIYALEQDWPRASVAMEKAMMLRTDKPLLRRNYVQVLEIQQRYAETLPSYEILCKVEPELVTNWVGWARALRTLGDEKKATQVLETALKYYQPRLARDPRGFQTNLDVGVLLAQLGRGDEALAHFQHALTLRPQADAALYNAGAVLYHLGRYDQARPLFEQFLQLYPGHERETEVRGWMASMTAPATRPAP